MSRPLMHLSWEDDGVTIVCTSEGCMVDGAYWTTQPLSYYATPEDAQVIRDAHLAERHPGEREG